MKLALLLGANGRGAGLALACSAWLALSGGAAAQTIRFIATTGSDANACTAEAPCRTLARGIAAAPVRGEVRLLDSGSFGNGVTIAKSLTISGQGNTLILAGRSAGPAGAAAINVNAAGAKVVFRDLLMNGRGVTENGILVTNAASVHIVDCEIERYGAGIAAVLVGNAVTELFVTGSSSRNNGAHGLFLWGSAPNTPVTVENSRFENNGDYGVWALRGNLSVDSSTFSGNGGVGLGGSGYTTMHVKSSYALNNRVGFHVRSGESIALEGSVASGNEEAGVHADGGLAIISNLTVTGNKYGVYVGSGGTVFTHLNSTVSGNTQLDTSPSGIYPLAGK
jgi:hypothetical protein